MTMALPGVSLEMVPPPAAPAPLRSDIAGFLGCTRRGPVGRAVRVAGRGEARRVFGAPGPAATGYALDGYFANGGELAWVVRVGGGGTTASADWLVGTLPGFSATRYRVAASSPGAWAERLTVEIRYRVTGVFGTPQVDVRVTAPGEPVQTLVAVSPGELVSRFAALELVRLSVDPAAPAPSPSGGVRRSATWTLTLAGGTDAAPTAADYRHAARALADEQEVAIVSAPDLPRHPNAGTRDEITALLLDDAAATLDRVVVLDGPAGGADAAVAAVARLRADVEPGKLRAGALYHPAVRVPDPDGPPAAPTRAVPCSGHVAGLISRLDRERGAHHSPANADVDDAVELEPRPGPDDLLALTAGGVNPLRCRPGQGLQVWGARTLDPAPAGRFLAHRRLVHRMVRAFRAVAMPLVFDVNSPELRLALVRALTTVLLEAFEAGALAGTRPAEAFRVTCDDTNNPAGQDPGLVFCDAEVAPAVPMEFIRLRLTLAHEGRLEVVEA